MKGFLNQILFILQYQKQIEVLEKEQMAAEQKMGEKKTLQLVSSYTRQPLCLLRSLFSSREIV